MKKILYSAIMVLIVGAGFTSCKKDKKKTTSNGLPDPINNIVSQAILDSLKKDGTIINAGTTPPNLTGTYLFSPNLCVFDNSVYSSANQVFSDYAYGFSNQNNSTFTIKVDYTALNAVDKGSDNSSTFISGSSNLFSVFAKTNGTETIKSQKTGKSYTINYSLLTIYSGQIVNGAINNFQTTNYFLSKTSDPENLLVPPGNTRIFVDSDGVSGTYTVVMDKPNLPKTLSLRTSSSANKQ